MIKNVYKTRQLFNDFVYDVVKLSPYPDGDDVVILTSSHKSVVFPFYDELCRLNKDSHYAVILRQTVKTLIYNSCYE